MCIIQITLFVFAILAFEVNSFTTCQRISSHSRLTFTTNDNDRNMRLNLFTEQQQLEIWVTTFSAAHIGMSAVRDDIINGFGELASNLKAVDRGFKLPSYWPGDDFGKDKIFPDKDTAGRQIYRMVYTFVSFATLGSALQSYLSIDETKELFLSNQQTMILFAISSASFAASIASLFNASPMSLMPSFQKVENSDQESSETPRSIAGLQRNDSLKMNPIGLTRITRHPLILPVVPWGVSTSYLVGGRIADFVLFGGLAAYALAGCACQDLRIIRKEGSVGTVMKLSTSDEGLTLQNFYEQTSFVPFGALIDGRQSVDVMVEEFPLIPFIAGIPVGAFIQSSILQFLSSY